MRLTEKGEKWLLRSILVSKMVAFVISMFLVVGFIGWVEALS